MIKKNPYAKQLSVEIREEEKIDREFDESYFEFVTIHVGFNNGILSYTEYVSKSLLVYLPLKK